METGESSIAELDQKRLIVADPDGGEPGGMDAPILLIGPEGGLAPDEIPPGCPTVSLGPTILRVETAAIVGAGLLSRSRPD